MDESTATVPYTKAQGAGDLNVVAIGFNQPQEERDGLPTPLFATTGYRCDRSCRFRRSGLRRRFGRQQHLDGGTAAPSGTSSSTSATTRYASAKATVIGKSTHVVVNPAISATLKHAGITVTAVAPATAKTTLLFPVSGGQIVLTTLAGTVDHTGGLTFSHSGKSVTLTNFVINTNTKQLTATVGGQSIRSST